MRQSRLRKLSGDAGPGQPIIKYRHLFLLLLLGFAVPAAAITVSPISAELDLSGRRSHLITVINTDEHRSVPVKVDVFTWMLTPQGADKRGPADDVIAFPGQFILKPGEQRSVRVAPRYTQAPDIEKTYRVLIYEVPVDLQGDASAEPRTGIRLLTAYATAFYVRPAKPRSELRLDAVQRRAGGLLFKLSNHGNAHTHLRHLRLLVTQDGTTARIEDPQAMQRFYNENVMAGSAREFAWQWPARGLDRIDTQRPLSVRMELECEACAAAHAVLETSVP